MTVPEAEALFEKQNQTIETLDSDLRTLNAKVATTEEAVVSSTADLEKLIPLRAQAEAEAAEVVRGNEGGKETMAKLVAWYVFVSISASQIPDQIPHRAHPISPSVWILGSPIVVRSFIHSLIHLPTRVP